MGMTRHHPPPICIHKATCKEKEGIKQGCKETNPSTLLTLTTATGKPHRQNKQCQAKKEFIPLVAQGNHK